MADTQQAPANGATANAAAHTASGGLGALAASYLVVRRNFDPLAAAAAVGVAAGALGRVGSWANDRLASGSKNLIVWLFSSWG